jgi:FKBP-type peptidyl-prolyl cis-trans isomerase FklB
MEKGSPLAGCRRLLAINALAVALGGTLALTGAGVAQAQDTPAAGAKSDAAAPKKSATKGAPKEAKEGTGAAADPKMAGSYSIGVSMGESLRGASLTTNEVSVDRIAQGIRDALSGKVKLTPADQENIQTLVKTARSSAGEANHAAAKAFLAENGKKKDVVTTASGLQYKVITPGSGDSPKPTDMVTVDYSGKLLDGTEFDSSYKRGQPATFPVNGVIPGWQEALGLMKPGSKYQLWIPPNLAYDLNSPPSIPPGSLLVFDVELKSVKPAQQAPQQPQIQPQAPKPAQPSK